MESRLKALGHPVHPMLVMFPVALFVTATLLDLIDTLGGPNVLGDVAYWNVTIGLIGGVLAAVAGSFDLLAIPTGTRAKRVGLTHALTNLAVVLLFAAVWAVRMNAYSRQAGGALLAVEIVAVAGLGVSAWLGGELVDRLGVGVDRDAHLDAPSSLHGPARPHHPAGASAPNTHLVEQGTMPRAHPAEPGPSLAGHRGVASVPAAPADQAAPVGHQAAPAEHVEGRRQTTARHQLPANERPATHQAPPGHPQPASGNQPAGAQRPSTPRYQAPAGRPDTPMHRTGASGRRIARSTSGAPVSGVPAGDPAADREMHRPDVTDPDQRKHP